MSKWDNLKKYINSRKIGDIITRKEIMYYIYDGPLPARYRGSYGSTVDNYRRILTRLGMLEHVDRGQYKLKYHIRKDLTTTHLVLLMQNGITLGGN